MFGRKGNRNREVLESFVHYCRTHPQERFWQALRNWSDNTGAILHRPSGADEEESIDTFYWEGKNA